MLRSARSSVLAARNTPGPASARRVVQRFASSTSEGKRPMLPAPSDIWVLPFQQAPQIALQRMDIFSCATAKSFAGIVSQLSKSALGFSIIANPIERTAWKPLYLPTWIWAAKVKGTAKRNASPFGHLPTNGGAMISINFGSGPLISRQDFPRTPQRVDGVSEEPVSEPPKEVTGTVVVKDCFFPGTSAMPLQYINVSPDDQIDRSLDSPVRKYDPKDVPSVFTAADLEELGSETIEALPFDMSPFAIPEVLAENAIVQSLPYTVETKSIEWQRLEAIPIYLPFYLANFKNGDHEFSLALAATDENIGYCDMHFPPPKGFKPEIKWPLKPLGSALHPGNRMFPGPTQESFIGNIDAEQFRLELGIEAVKDPGGSELEAADKEKAETAAFLEGLATAAISTGLAVNADRWLNGDGVRTKIWKASGAGVRTVLQDKGRIVPFIKRDFAHDEDE